MAFSNMKVNDFINEIIKYDNIDDIINKCKTSSEKGYIFERLWDIVIKFGFCSIFPNSQFNHMMGNSNDAKLKPLENFKKYLDEKVISGNSSGISDITLQHKDTNKWIFNSAKYFLTDKDIKDYDVQSIVAMIDNNREIYKIYEMYLLVPDKNKILSKKSNKSSQYITKYFSEDKILDKTDLNKYFLAFKQDIIKNKDKDWNETYLTGKENLILRFHQELITQKTSNHIEEGNKSFLWGCKCRSGKTYMIGGLIIKQFDINTKLNVLIITPAPTETAPQFTDDLFNKFKDFNNFKIHHIEGSKLIEGIVLAENNIFVMSKQLLQKYINKDTIKKIKNLNLDIIAFDENHFSGTSDLSKAILESYSSKNTVKIYLTATYNKPLKEWNISEECQMYWDIEDEQICKSILVDNQNTSKLIEKHGDTITNTIKHYTNLGMSISDIFSSYKNMPDLHLLTTMFGSQIYDVIKEKIKDSKYGFSFDGLFSLNKNKTKFQYETQVKTILRYISGSNKEEDFKNGDKSFFSRIKKICSEKESRLPFTHIWFLPSDNINEISVCLEKLMMEDGILKKYSVMCINRKNKELAKDVKDEIMKQELIAKSEGKEGLILLAGNMLTLGITLNNCDVVLLLNNTLSSDKVLQQMYRCMTEGNNKKIGYVIDLNISRVINTCINYTIYKNDKSIEDKIKYLIENHLINIDVDMMENKKINSDLIVKKLMDIWKGDPINSLKSLLRHLDNEYVEYDSDVQKLINKFFISSVRDKVGIDVIVKDEDDEIQEVPSGKEITKETESETLVNSELEEEQNNISFTKDVLPYIIPLVCILTIKNNNKDFVKMLNDIYENPELLDIFDEMTEIWWNKKDLLKLIKDIVCKYFDKNSNTYNISINFKMSLQSLIDSPKELLELINECLKPKDIEKKKFGEVFTPMHFINDKMLMDLETYYKDKYNKNIFEDEKLTWFDSTAGMGNFPIAIYYKLMEGLKLKIPDEQDRKKHILENMIYMAEMNAKNCFVIKQIFNINNELNINLYVGDSLNIDINKEFNIKKFDIIIGNPPYNEELKSTGAKALYNKFVEYYIDKCNILTFVIPSRWFSGGKGLDTFRKNMLNRTDIVYINHINDACTIFGNQVDIKGGVNYFLKDTNYKGLCNYNGTLTKLNKYEVFVDGKYHSIIDKILQFDSISKIYLGRYFGFESNDKRLKNEKTKDNVICYVSKQKGGKKYVDKVQIKKEYNFFKVITARAAHEHQSGFGDIFIGNIDEIHTGSYISFKVNSEKEAQSLLSYLKCRLPNFMLSLRKNSQDISDSTCEWIPLPPLNKEWNDNDVYKYFKLSNDDIKLINNTKITGYDKNKTEENDDENIINNEVKPKKTRAKKLVKN